MSVKSIFRWLCAELDGFYIQGCHTVLNNLMDDITYLFYYMKNMQVIRESTSSAVPAITEDDLYGIGTIAGVLIPYITAESTQGSLRFTTSHKVNGTEYSERGLFNRSSAQFDFKRTDGATYTDDINTLATSTDQTSVVEAGAAVVGYLPEGVEALDSSGYVDESKLVATEPTDKASSPYYGKKYLHTSTEFMYQAKMAFSVYFTLFKVMQRLRYSGASIVLFAELTETILSDYVQDITFTSMGVYTIVTYSINADSTLEDKVTNMYVWEALVNKKFPTFVLSEA